MYVGRTRVVRDHREVEGGGEEESLTSESATKRCITGRRGCMNLHSLCERSE